MLQLNLIECVDRPYKFDQLYQSSVFGCELFTGGCPDLYQLPDGTLATLRRYDFEAQCWWWMWLLSVVIEFDCSGKVICLI